MATRGPRYTRHELRAFFRWPLAVVSAFWKHISAGAEAWATSSELLMSRAKGVRQSDEELKLRSAGKDRVALGVRKAAPFLIGFSRRPRRWMRAAVSDMQKSPHREMSVLEQMQ